MQKFIQECRPLFESKKVLTLDRSDPMVTWPAHNTYACRTLCMLCVNINVFDVLERQTQKKTENKRSTA